MSTPGPGDTAPDFTLPTNGDASLTLSELRGKKVVLFFYPKDDTPGCTAQACSFRDNSTTFQSLGAEVWGVSGDDAISHRRFATRYGLNFPLLWDRNNSLRRSLGVPRALGLMPGRVTYVVDGEGVIRHVFSNLLDGPAHVREAMQVLHSLRSQA